MLRRQTNVKEGLNAENGCVSPEPQRSVVILISFLRSEIMVKSRHTCTLSLLKCHATPPSPSPRPPPVHPELSTSQGRPEPLEGAPKPPHRRLVQNRHMMRKVIFWGLGALLAPRLALARSLWHTWIERKTPRWDIMPGAARTRPGATPPQICPKRA